MMFKPRGEVVMSLWIHFLSCSSRSLWPDWLLLGAEMNSRMCMEISLSFL